MSRIDALADRLHPLLREGETVRAVLAPPAVAAEIATEDAVEVRRAHQFDDVLTLGEAAALAALLDFAPKPWQTLPLFRAWVHATRDAILAGAVTRRALDGFARAYAAAHQAATGTRIGVGAPELIENPLRRRVVRPAGLAIAPLGRLSIATTAIADAPVSILFTGLAGGPEPAPLVANVTTGQALVWRGAIPCGSHLALRPTATGGVEALLDGQDASDRLIALEGLVPGTAWAPTAAAPPARPLSLRRGANLLWFLPVGLFDTDGLGRFLYALPDLSVDQGRWDETRFDQALFAQEPAVQMLASWMEPEPAAVALDVPGATVLRPATAAGPADADRDLLVSALDVGLSRLKAAGVRLEVRPRPFAECQGGTDRITAVLPMRLREAGVTGGEHGSEIGGRWGVTDFDGSTFV